MRRSGRAADSGRPVLGSTDGYAVFTSDLRRSLETVEVAVAGTGMPALSDRRLRGCDYGRYNGTSGPGCTGSAAGTPRGDPVGVRPCARRCADEARTTDELRVDTYFHVRC